jgi:hypothetical protein
MRFLYEEEWAPYHQQVLCALSTFSQKTTGIRTHSAGLEYTSLMSCFLMHNVAATRSLLDLYKSSGVEWFPVTVGYVIARSMFEVDVTAHYISQKPQERARLYILFEHVLNKRAMDACKKHRTSDNPSWRETMEIKWRAGWEEREQDIKKKYAEVAPLFTRKKGGLFSNWHGKSLRDLAVEVDHEEAYDSFYSDLSSFTHADVRMANRYLRIHTDHYSWTQRANLYDVGKVLHDAASFLTCYLKLFGSQFGLWDETSVDACWTVEGFDVKKDICEAHE